MVGGEAPGEMSFESLRNPTATGDASKECFALKRCACHLGAQTPISAILNLFHGQLARFWPDMKRYSTFHMYLSRLKMIIIITSVLHLSIGILIIQTL
jgi:hypothetical protein